MSDFSKFLENPFLEIPYFTPQYVTNNIHKLRRKKRMEDARHIASHTPEQWNSILEEFQNRCVKCGYFGMIQKDHIIPIYQGGSDGVDNIQPLCQACNNGKGSDSTDWKRFRRNNPF